MLSLYRPRIKNRNTGRSTERTEALVGVGERGAAGSLLGWLCGALAIELIGQGHDEAGPGA